MVTHISTHTSLAGRDQEGGAEMGDVRISTHTSLAGRDLYIVDLTKKTVISTHTSLAGRDSVTGRRATSPAYFYSHVPRGT